MMMILRIGLELPPPPPDASCPGAPELVDVAGDPCMICSISLQPLNECVRKMDCGQFTAFSEYGNHTDLKDTKKQPDVRLISPFRSLISAEFPDDEDRPHHFFHFNTRNLRQTTKKKLPCRQLREQRSKPDWFRHVLRAPCVKTLARRRCRWPRHVGTRPAGLAPIARPKHWFESRSRGALRAFESVDQVWG